MHVKSRHLGNSYFGTSYETHHAHDLADTYIRIVFVDSELE